MQVTDPTSALSSLKFADLADEEVTVMRVQFKDFGSKFIRIDDSMESLCDLLINFKVQEQVVKQHSGVFKGTCKVMADSGPDVPKLLKPSPPLIINATLSGAHAQAPPPNPLVQSPISNFLDNLTNTEGPGDQPEPDDGSEAALAGPDQAADKTVNDQNQQNL
mmetsp:Transcript_23079/g.30718  ORF Transcript_23079/g.30718 Transcript_23079/m.30718 type:complete len:163 (+) Transcript_23079:459-947(+)|eukprot:CAMPEP_0185589810 /NCGR_PEP_ID=MMETSP0434-20130131/58410_1 /TAXON_ID=626734 ORGANISM="Favella taraikaensis, Strain Fe Narragansett Bay" /NCGR_SAMPLE_ID=MMETSP0434 /ASSEMBLY_ACC=CAM_ASM_000379 /LENGTH=162 /DNA_ID=CAMNT_0028213507 /DNA_START=382 /DNA_END=870 /DNA_ORIENTATION=-